MRLAGVFLGWFLCLAGLMAGEAEGLMGLLRPEIRPFTGMAHVAGEREPLREGDGVAFARTAWRGGIMLQPWCDEDEELQLGVRGGWQSLTCDGALPRTGPLPEHLQEAYVLAGWRHLTPARWLWAVNLQVGGAGDAFDGRDTASFMANVLLRVPTGAEDGWVFMVNEANNRTFLNYVPIPMIAYHLVRGRELNALIGIIVNVVTWRPTAWSDLTAAGSVFGAASVGAGVSPTPLVRIGVGWEMTSESWRRRERNEPRDVLFLRENRVLGRLRVGTPLMGGECFGGWVLKREWREAETFASAGGNRLELPPGPVFGISGRWRY